MLLRLLLLDYCLSLQLRHCSSSYMYVAVSNTVTTVVSPIVFRRLRDLDTQPKYMAITTRFG